jgi:Protein of unknown function (DUF3040)
MGLTRRQRRELAALGEQLGREDPDLAAQLSRPAGSTFHLRRGRTPTGVVAGRALLVLGLTLVAYGLALSVPTVTMVGAITLTIFWIPWQHGRGLTPR